MGLEDSCTDVPTGRGKTVEEGGTSLGQDCQYMTFDSNPVAHAGQFNMYSIPNPPYSRKHLADSLNNAQHHNLTPSGRHGLPSIGWMQAL